MTSYGVAAERPPRALWCASLILVLAAASASGHPHDDPETFVLRGTLTKVDLVNQAIEMDIITPKMKAGQNLLLFLDKKAKIRNGKARMDVAELKASQQVRCTVERMHQDGKADRLIAFEVQLLAHD
jgi:hypothetical protein